MDGQILGVFNRELILKKPQYFEKYAGFARDFDLVSYFI